MAELRPRLRGTYRSHTQIEPPERSVSHIIVPYDRISHDNRHNAMFIDDQPLTKA